MAMLVLESDKPLGDDAHRYYDELIRRLRADPKHVPSVGARLNTQVVPCGPLLTIPSAEPCATMG